MYIKQDYDFSDLTKEVWQGAIKTINTIENEGKGDQLMSFLKELYFEEIPTMTEINDLLWHDPQIIYDALGIQEDKEDEDE